MLISVIICTYSERRIKDVLEAVDSVLNQSFNNLEIILVVDNNHKLFRFLHKHYKDDSRVKVLHNIGKRGLSASRNLGVSNAKGNIIAFMDDDAVADENWIANIVRNYEDPSVIGAGGVVLPIWIAKPSKFLLPEFYWVVGVRYRGYPHKRIVRNTFGSNFSFRKVVFEKVGLFDTSLGRIGESQISGEEADFSIRAMLHFKGGIIVYDPSAVVRHKVFSYRVRLPFIISRLFNTGVAIGVLWMKYRWVKGLNVLSSETSFLEKVLKVFIPSRLRRVFYRRHALDSMGDLLLIIIYTIIVGAGFLYGTFKSRRSALL